MLKLLFLINILVTIILLLFFRKTIFISKGSVIKINYTKSGLISEAIGYFVFASFIIYIFFISNAFNGWTLLISLPFTALVLSPFFNIIKRINSNEIILINLALNSITIEGFTYGINNFSKIKVVKRIGQNSIDTDDYILSLVTNVNSELTLIVLSEKKEVILIIDELEKLLKLPLECFKDGGLLGVKRMPREHI